MKSKVFIVALAAVTVIGYVSCQWFSGKEKPQTLIGKWQMVNVADSAKDPSKNSTGLLLLAMAAKDSLSIEFKEDSSLLVFTSGHVDSSKYSLHFDELIVTAENDTSYFSMKFISKDSLNLIASADSIHYLFRRLK